MDELQMAVSAEQTLTPKRLDWEKQSGLIPAIVQNNETGEILMLGYMSEESLAVTLKKGLATFWSRSREELWTKGETSGNTLTVSSIATDCDRDTLLVRAIPAGPTCHRDILTCFSDDQDQLVSDVRLSAASWDTLEASIDAIDETFDLRVAQIDDEVTESYTLGLLRDPNRAAKKLGEEFMEFVASVEGLDEAATTEELADFVFAALTFARGRGKNIRLKDAISLLVFRNQRKRAGSDERFILQAQGSRDE